MISDFINANIKTWTVPDTNDQVPDRSWPMIDLDGQKRSKKEVPNFRNSTIYQLNKWLKRLSDADDKKLIAKLETDWDNECM